MDFYYIEQRLYAFRQCEKATDLYERPSKINQCTIDGMFNVKYGVLGTKVGGHLE